MKTGNFIKLTIFSLLLLLIMPTITFAAESDSSKATTTQAIELTSGPPASPSDLTAIIISPTAIQLKWKDNSSKEEGFTLAVRNSGSTTSSSRGIASNAVQYVDDSLITGLFYHYKIGAYGAEGSSDWSNDVIVELAAPKAPTNLTATAASQSTVQLSWIDNATNESGYKIERQQSGGKFTQINVTAKDITGYTDNGLKPGTVYTYRIMATNVIGNSPYSESAITMTTEAPTAPVQQPGSIDYSTASSWAVPEIEGAVKYNLATDKLLSSFNQKITREEFCEIAVKLYEALSGKKALPVIANPFSDTVNTEVLKACNLGIVNGISKVSFGPDNLISRQEICVMIFRALKAADPSVSSSMTGVEKFADEKSIASWAINEVRFASKNGIMKGTNGNKIAPLEMVTREQAIVMLKRTYDSYK
jgi:hypothetical protein